MSSGPASHLRLRIVFVVVALVLFAGVFLAGLYVQFFVVVPYVLDAVVSWLGVIPQLAGFTLIAFLLAFLAPVWTTVEALRRSSISRLSPSTIYPGERPPLTEIVNRLAAQADVPAPELRLVNSPAPTALTVGIRPSSTKLLVTTGLLETCSDEQLAAVVAHELGHVRHRDGAVMYVAHVLPAVTYALAETVYELLFGRFHGTGTLHAGRSRRPEDLRTESSSRTRMPSTPPNGRGILAVIVGGVIAFISVVLTAVFAGLLWIASTYVLTVLSRTREYAADRFAADLLDDPAIVADTLATLDAGMVDLPEEDLREMDGAHESLYVLGMDDDWFGEHTEGLLTVDVFPPSHPPTSDRIERLLEMDTR